VKYQYGLSVLGRARDMMSQPICLSWAVLALWDSGVHPSNSTFQIGKLAKQA
jgi:hypothetical protein